jgi:hypothetical protein
MILVLAKHGVIGTFADLYFLPVLELITLVGEQEILHVYPGVVSSVWGFGAQIEMKDVRGDSVLWMDKQVGF